ncbi:hypothetical protein TRIP_C20047 [Candidatus Zixiibacteriota bacterium]|nr:hypothetical protein TRIP_C20047 [candidate division Zixibacteria bacterium]
MRVEPIPFKQFNESLQNNLRTKQILDAAKWLVGSQPTGVLALACNSNWEAALSIEFLTWTRHILEQHKEESILCSQIVTRIGETANRLLASAKWINDPILGEICTWEGVTWDTSVVIRGLLTALRACPSEFADKKQAEIERTVEGALHWLAHRFDIWETDVKFPFGACDVAQILITLVMMRAYHMPLLKKAEHAGYLSRRAKPRRVPLEADIVRYLLKEADVEKSGGDGRSRSANVDREDVLYYWGNYFQTAEVIEALAYAYASFHGTPICPIETIAGKLKDLIEPDQATAMRIAVMGGLRYLETHQINGEWGTHVDTFRCLYAYIRASYLLRETPEAPIVFRALRWTCDEKQVFVDGSLMHTMFLTIFYCFALEEVYEHWELAERPMLELYDDVVWASQANTTIERGKRMLAEMERDKKESERIKLNEDVSGLKRSIATLSVILSGLILGPTIGHLLGVFKLSISATPASDIVAFLTLLMTIITSLIVLIWTIKK